MLNNNDDIQEPILVESNDNKIITSEIPLSTKWKVKCSCCCCGPLVEVNVPNKRRKRYFLQGWECRPCMPIIVSCLILYSTIANFVCFFPYQYLIAQIILPIFILIFFVLFVWSYFAAVCMDPGYLPFNWAQTKKFKYSWEEQISGLAICEEQFNYALTKENRPPKSSFSHSAGRYVIRADHICGWIANWVGKRNHKQFILMNLYGGIYALTLSIGPFCVKKFFSLPLSLMFSGIFAFSIDISFAFSLLSMFGNTIVDLYLNRTKLHRMRDEVKDKNQINSKTDLNETIYQRKVSMKASMQEVFGNRSYCSWLLPTPAFDDSLIIEDDPNEIFQPVDEQDRPRIRSRHLHRHLHRHHKNSQDEDIEYDKDINLNENIEEGLENNNFFENDGEQFNDDNIHLDPVNTQSNDEENAQLNNDNIQPNDVSSQIEKDDEKINNDHISNDDQ